MKLKTKISLIVLMTWAVMATLFYFDAHRIIHDNYHRIFFIYSAIFALGLWLLLQYLIVKRIENLAKNIHQTNMRIHTPSKLRDNLADEVSLIAKAYYQATHDPLTGLASRHHLYQAFREHSRQWGKPDHKIVVIIIDVDNFKKVNNTLGCDVGDKILAELSKRIQSELGDKDLAGRIGGDEFVIMLIDIHKDKINSVTNRILKNINQPITHGSHDIYCTNSMGVCIFPDDGDTIETLIKYSDMALQHAKDNGRNHYQFYSTSLSQSIIESHKKEIELKYALDENQFILYYQPIYDLRTKEIVSMEALIRWNHPTRGLLGPGEIIPAAERSELIYPIGDWVLNAACQQMMSWKNKQLPVVPIAINISAIQLTQNDLSDKIIKTLSKYNLSPNLIEIEITETGFVHITPQLIYELKALKTAGIKLIIDDFGTGYAGLGYLKSLPVSKLKIDQSFIRDIQTDPDDKAITLAIIAIAHQLNLRVTAEGVENIAQYNFMCYHQVDEVQGHFLSKPLTSDECERLLSGDQSGTDAPQTD